MIGKIVGLIVCGLLFLGIWFALVPAYPDASYVLPSTPATTSSADAVPQFESHWISRGETTEVHSASIAMAQGEPFAVWYAGTEEGHRDVALYWSRFDGAAGDWSQPVAFIDRAGSEAALGRYIRKVGNPALHVWPDGGIGVFYVTVSIGGWAASAINYMESPNLGETWSRPERLVTSPFLNLSTLVRTHANVLGDGSIELPVYHEFMGKFAETLRLTRSHAVVRKTRLSRGKHSLQPAIAPLSSTDAVALLRYSGQPPNRLLESTTDNAGRSWSKPEKNALPNPDAAVALIRLNDGTLLLALNDTEDGRHRLSLATRRGNEPWQITRAIEDEPPESPEDDFQFSYPSFAVDLDGAIHLVYTWNKSRIRHLKFNQAWLAGSSTD